MAFIVGDLIVGTECNDYGITNQNSICIVKRLQEDDGMDVIVLAHKVGAEGVGATYGVNNSEEFEKITLLQLATLLSSGDYYYDDIYNEIQIIREECGYFENDKSLFIKTHMPIRNPDTERHFEWGKELNVYGLDAEDLLHEYGYHVTRPGLEKILKTNFKNKTAIENLFMKSELYNPKTRQLVFTTEFSRVYDQDTVDRFVNKCHHWAEKYALKNEYKVNGKTKREYSQYLDKISNLYTDLNTVRFYSFVNTIVEFNSIMEEKLNLNVDFMKETEKRVAELKEMFAAQYNKLSNKMNEWFSDYMTYTTTGYGYSIMIKTELKVKLSSFTEFLSLIGSLGDNKLSATQADKINELYNRITGKNLGCTTESKLSRIMQKFCVAVGLKDDPDLEFDWEKEYAVFSNAVNPKKEKHKCVLSINPIDFWTMSFGNSWSSCHTIDKINQRGKSGDSYQGCYSSGTESYMLDGTSFIFYTVNMKTESDFEKQNKILRCMFHMGEDKIVQGRLYPQKMDYNGKILYDEIREAVVKMITNLISDSEIETYNKTGTAACRNVIKTKGTHYQDYNNFSQCNITYLLDASGNKNLTRITVGHNPICPVCGLEHEEPENIICSDCVGEYYDHYNNE